MTDPLPTGESPPIGKGKPPHLPVGKGHIDEENRRARRTGGHPDHAAREGPKVNEIPPNARSEHDQPPGGFRKGVPSRITFVDEDSEE